MTTTHLTSRIKTRCFNPKSDKFQYYGGRGITVCDEWKHSFETFLQDMGRCPIGFTIERKDNNLGYSPSNCIWATQETQASNKSNNRFLECFGEKLTLSAWARRLGVSPSLISQRLNKFRWPVEMAVSTPPRHGHH